MKSEPSHFSPTSAGVRFDHLNFHQISKNNCADKNNKSNNNSNCCNSADSNNNCNKTTFSLPRARVLPTPSTSSASQEDDEHRRFLELEQVVVRNQAVDPTASKTGKNSFTPRRRHKPNNKMRNCLVIAGIAIILSLLSFVFLVECRSIKGSSHSPKKHYNYDDTEISSESRIQDDSVQEPDPESSEEHPKKVVSTTSTSKDATPSSSVSSVSSSSSSSAKSSTSTKRSSGSSSANAGRLTRSRVSVICKGGHAGILEDDLGSTSTSTFPSSSSKKPKSQQGVNFPILLPRDSDDTAEEENGGERNDWDDEEGGFSSEESQQQVITITGYSHVAGGKPETKSLVKSGSSTAIKYVPKPERKGDTSPSGDDSESGSSEEVEVSPKPKASSAHNKHHKSKAQKVAHKTHPEPVSSVIASDTSASHKSSSSNNRKGKHQNRHSKRESSEEEDEEEEVTTTTRAPKRSSKHSSKKSSKRSGSGRAKDVSSSPAPKNEKGDSSEIEEESLLPTLRSSKSDSKGERGRKASERRPKPITPFVVDPELESAEAEPESVSTTTRKPKSSRSRKSKSRSSTSNNDSKKEASTIKPADVLGDISTFSSEEYNMEEMPFTAPAHENGSKKGKPRRSSSSNGSSQSSRNSRMRTKTVAPKQRTGTFSSVENEND